MNFAELLNEKQKEKKRRFYFLYEGDDQNSMNIYKLLFGTILNI